VEEDIKLISVLLTCRHRSGTWQYGSPELLSKSHLHGTTSDYWCLGITLFELAYGARPFSLLPSEFLEYANQRNYYLRDPDTVDKILDIEDQQRYIRSIEMINNQSIFDVLNIPMMLFVIS
jgi:serine/threonine protein kinase